MLTKRLFCLISVFMVISILTPLTDSLLSAQDSLTVFSDTTSVLDTDPDTFEQSNLDDWFPDSLPQQSFHSSLYDALSSLPSFFIGAMGLTSIIAILVTLFIILFPLIAIIAIIVLIYKLQKEKQKNQSPEGPQMTSRPAPQTSRQNLKDKAINRFMWGVALLILYWIIGGTILAVISVILFCIAGSQYWRFKSSLNQSENPYNNKPEGDQQKSSAHSEPDQALNHHNQNTDHPTDKQQDE